MAMTEDEMHRFKDKAAKGDAVCAVVYALLALRECQAQQHQFREWQAEEDRNDKAFQEWRAVEEAEERRADELRFWDIMVALKIAGLTAADCVAFLRKQIPAAASPQDIAGDSTIRSKTFGPN
jgi:hypothetical protein